jgi:acetoin utilization deacetylase AcuC-like enzyme
MGFCTFNGLMIASAKLLVEHSKHFKKIAIIDCDAHYGNGTDDILDHLPEFSDSIYHYTFGKKFPDRHGRTPYTFAEGNKYIEEFPYVERDLVEFKPDLVIYQAGADPHINDPYGGILTTEQMYIRDLKMFSICNRLNIPIAWNLAGGYQVGLDGDISKVIELHLNTLKAAISVYG